MFLLFGIFLFRALDLSQLQSSIKSYKKKQQFLRKLIERSAMSTFKDISLYDLISSNKELSVSLIINTPSIQDFLLFQGRGILVKLLSISRSYQVLIEIIKFCDVSKTIIRIDSEDILNSVFKTLTKIVCLTNENTSIFETRKEVKSTILQPYQIFVFRQKTFIKFEIPQQFGDIANGAGKILEVARPGKRKAKLVFRSLSNI